MARKLILSSVHTLFLCLRVKGWASHMLMRKGTYDHLIWEIGCPLAGNEQAQDTCRKRSQSVIALAILMQWNCVVFWKANVLLRKEDMLKMQSCTTSKKIKAFKDKNKESFIFIRVFSPEQKKVPPGPCDFSSTSPAL